MAKCQAQDEGARAKVAEAEGAVAAIQARIVEHDAQTGRLDDDMEACTTEHGAANKPVKVRVPCDLVGSATLLSHSTEGSILLFKLQLCLYNTRVP